MWKANCPRKSVKFSIPFRAADRKGATSPIRPLPCGRGYYHFATGDKPVRFMPVWYTFGMYS